MTDSQTWNVRRMMLFISMMIVAVLTACSRDSDKSAGLSAVSFWNIGMSDQGFVENIDDTIWYYDLKSGKSAALMCKKKSNCKDNPYYKYDANGYGIGASVMYKDSLYVFVNESLNETIVYRMKPQLDGREKVATIKWEISSGKVLIHNEKVYFSGAQIVINEDGTGGSSNQILSIITLDLSTGKVKELGDPHHYDRGGSAIDSLTIVGDKLRYRYVYEDMTDEEREALENRQLSIEQSEKLLKTTFYEINLKTSESQLTMNGSDYPGISMEADESYAYFMNDDKTKVYRVSFNDFQQRDLFEGKDIHAISNGIVPGKGLFFSQGYNNNTVYYYDFKTRKVISINLEDSSLPLFSFKDWLVFGKTINGQYTTVYNTLDDYLAAKDNYIMMK